MATKRLRPKIYAMEDVEKHNNEQSCWVTYQGGVYDVTSLVSHSLPSIAFLSSSTLTLFVLVTFAASSEIIQVVMSLYWNMLAKMSRTS